MSFLLLGASLTVLVFATTSALAGALSALCFSALRRRIEEVEPARRARLLLALRLFPTVAAVAFTGGLFWPAFALFEPRNAVEPVGGPLALAALASLAAVGRGPVRAFFDRRRTERLVGGWLSKSASLDLPGAPVPARLVEASFPVVAIFGIRRPRLLVARSVRERCTDEELAAVVEHERGHLANLDNLKRMLFRAAPDPLAWSGIAARMERSWSEAIEEAADRLTPRELALPLASALVKVSRLALDARPLPSGASALYESGPIARRIRHLTEEEGASSPASVGGLWLVPGIVLALSTLAGPVGLLHRIHTLTESIVAVLQ